MGHMIVVGLALRDKERDYSSLIAAIKGYGAWWNYLPSVWIIHCDSDVQAVSKTLRPHISEGTDALLVVELKADQRQGWLPEKAWQWFRDLGH